MGIAEADVAKVRAATDLAGLIGEHTSLKRVGRRLVGLCPFHSEKSPSFSVNSEEGLYYCFGCQARGDAITFVREAEKCGFVEAVELLAARAGVSIEVTDDPVQRAERYQRQRLAEVMGKAVEWYHAYLLDAPEARPARDYLRSRGYDGETARRFRLGYAPAGPEALVRALEVPVPLLAEVGLAWAGSRGRPMDVFRERVIFPIFDVGGHPVALGGRILPEALRRSSPGGPSGRDPGPKYRNSAESPLYVKRRTLYGLNWAKTDIGHTDEAVVCEGYTDVIGCFRAGVERAVATCGTSLTEDHIKVLANFTKRVVLAFDADSAGQNAAARLYEWERRHDIELKVAALPAGSDPGELAERDPAALAAAIAGARPFLAFVVERALGTADLSSPEGRARAAQAAVAAIAEHPDAMVRDPYLQRVGDLTRQSPERLRAEFESVRGQLAAGGGQRSAGGGQPALRRRDVDATHGRPGSHARGSDGAAPSGRAGVPAPGAARQASGPGYDSPPEPPEEAPWDDDAPVDRSYGSSAGQGRRAPRPTAERSRAGRDVLLFAIHRPAELVPLLEAGMLQRALFADPLQRAAFDDLSEADELHHAIARSQPEIAELLTELAVSEPPPPVALAEEAVFALARHAAERALSRAESEARLAERDEDIERHARAAADCSSLSELLGPLRDPIGAGGEAARQAALRLVASLMQQELEDG